LVARLSAWIGRSAGTGGNGAGARLEQLKVKENERDGQDFGARKRRQRGGAAGGPQRGRGIFVGLLVSGGAELRDRGAAARESDAARSAVGDGTNRQGQSLCDAGCVSAPRDSALVWAL